MGHTEHFYILSLTFAETAERLGCKLQCKLQSGRTLTVLFPKHSSSLSMLTDIKYIMVFNKSIRPPLFKDENTNRNLKCIKNYIVIY